MRRIIRQLLIRLKRRKQGLNALNYSSPSFINTTARFTFHRNINLGRYVRIGDQCYLSGEGGISIGEGTMLAPKVTILSSSHDYSETNSYLPYADADVKKHVEIGKGSWIGYGAMIAPGVKLGDGVVVAMGSVVTKSFNSGVLIGGNPAAEIKKIRSEEDINTALQAERFFLKGIYEGELSRNVQKSLNQFKV